jgi:hypothetical protein
MATPGSQGHSARLRSRLAGALRGGTEMGEGDLSQIEEENEAQSMRQGRHPHHDTIQSVVMVSKT